ncbi:MAG: high-potential iron-sulfur protein [Pseudomonadota bacterium]
MTPSRRTFIGKLSMLAAAVAIPSVGWAIGKKKKKKKKAAAAAGDAGAAMAVVDVTNKKDSNVATLLALNYVANVKEAIANKDVTVAEKGGIKPEAQGCKNCVLAVKDGDNYKCQLVPAGKFYVHPEGWCTSWNPKA